MSEIKEQKPEQAQTTQEHIDVGTYERVKPYLASALEQIIQAGRSVWDFANFAIDKFGDELIPYVQKFLKEVREGSVKLANMTASVWVGLLETGIDRHQREQMIREAAYFRAQRRGFIGGDPDQDWIEAEQEVDSKLLADIGVLAKGRKGAVDAIRVVEDEIGDVAQTVHRWLDARNPFHHARR